MIRDDSAMNLSPDMFETFIRPYDQRLLDRFGGGAIHFCGRGDHFIPLVSEMRGVYAVHMSQPHLNDMKKLLSHLEKHDINLLGLSYDVAMEAAALQEGLKPRMHCWQDDRGIAYK